MAFICVRDELLPHRTRCGLGEKTLAQPHLQQTTLRGKKTSKFNWFSSRTRIIFQLHFTFFLIFAELTYLPMQTFEHQISLSLLEVNKCTSRERIFLLGWGVLGRIVGDEGW